MLEGGPGDAVDTAGKKRERARDVSLVTTADWVTVYWFMLCFRYDRGCSMATRSASICNDRLSV